VTELATNAPPDPAPTANMSLGGSPRSTPRPVQRSSVVRSGPDGPERGQSTVEYALLLLGAAAIALVVVAWVTRTDLIGRLFDTVIGRILSQA